MSILYLLIPLSLMFVFVIGVVLWWSAGSGQFENLEKEGARIFDDETVDHTQP